MAAAAGTPPGNGRRDPAELEIDREDSRWVEQARSGDLSAFERLYRRHAPRVHGLCLRMAADRGLAEELTQDVFVRVWEKLHTFRSERSFRAWLRAVAVNVVLSRRRWSRRHTSRMVSVDDAGPPRDSAEPMKEHRMDLDKAIAGLPERARVIFVLHDVEGYRHAEIARLTGLAVGTSKAQLHRARRLLREVLER